MIDAQKTTGQKVGGVKHYGEGGLLGMALDPDFGKNNYIYLYLTTQYGTGLKNRVERYVFKDGQLQDSKIIIDNIPGAIYHDGGKLAFGPDGFLYITTGDATNGDFAQDKNSLAGKILRIKSDGSIPEDNPFKNAVYSYGHRNPQGITWDDKGRLWATEHGRSGITSGMDEINLIIKGGNYGWPEIEGDEEKEGMIKPVIHSGPDETWAPAGIIYLKGSLFFSGLKGESLYQAEIISDKELKLKTHFKEQFGRLRALKISQAGDLYISTSNTDGRGNPKEGDDKIIKIPPQSLP